MSKTVAEIEEEQKERREYVKNIGIEYRFGCYEKALQGYEIGEVNLYTTIASFFEICNVFEIEKRSDSCHLLGEYMEAIEQNMSAALKLFKKNCEEHENPASCYKYAMYLLAGKECTRSLKEMQKPLEISCQSNFAKGCRYLSLVHWNAEAGKPINVPEAEKNMKRACELEDGESCWLLSTWYMGGGTKFKTAAESQAKEKKVQADVGKLDRNMDKALEYGIRACEFDIAQSCANVSRMFKLGDGIEKNLDKAQEFAEKTKELIEILKKKDAESGFTG